MIAIEKKFEIEMKLKKEMSNIQELKAAASRSSSLANDVCNVLGACEQRLQQLETAVLPLYGDTARLQHIHQNMERTAKALDHVISYYMVSRELADLIQGGPHTTSIEALNIYLEALDKLAEAQNYFNKNNPQSVELENINQLYNIGVTKLENAFEELLSRHTRPLAPTTLMDMIALEEDSSADSVSVGASGSGVGAEAAREWLAAAASWLGAAGRPPAAALLRLRAPAARASLQAFKDYLRSRSMAASPLMRAKNMLHRSDSATKKTSKIQKVLEKRANKIMMKASQTLEQSTGLAIGSRRSMNDSYTEESNETLDEYEAEVAGTVAAALVRLARHEQRQLLGLVPLQRLPALLSQVLKDCFQILANDVDRALGRVRRGAARGGGGGGGGAGWALLARLRRLQPDLERALAPASPAPYAALLASCQAQCLRSLEEWVEGVRACGAAGAVDGTVHQLAAAALAHLHALAAHKHTIGPALATDPAYNRGGALQARDPHAAMLALYMRKVLAQLNLALRNKSEQYPDALKAIFLLNNTLYLLQGLQRDGLLDVLMLAEPECEANYRDMIQEYKNAYLQSWNKLLQHTVLDEPLPAKLRDKDRQMLKDKFAAFNREWEEACRSQRGYSVPDAELREALKRDNKQALLPPYTAFWDACAPLPFSKNPDKYLKYSPVQIATQLDGYFDEAA
ncbi:exocyst complex component 7 [Galleria mellonella]|uniref:Exocyst complex component 7 n=1 Tax=Galleria mellonella TaxID=7137 RepID=A0A6J1WRC6_GALME|nr:exocyst complex component 7 [Galleria mellonella]